MAWTVPKISWKESDYFLLSDWKRIVENAQYLKSLIGATFTWRDCSLSSTTDLPYYDIVNNLERNLEDLWDALNLGSYVVGPTWTYRLSPQWTRNPDYMDFNRWEHLELNIFVAYNTIINPKNVLRAGAFYAGSNRTTQLFSRGR